MNILRWVLGFVSIIFVAITLPFAMSNPEIKNQWLMIALSIPNIIVIGWFVAEAMQPMDNNPNQPELEILESEVHIWKVATTLAVLGYLIIAV
ncbi:MAG: hypothetical protein GY797_18125, partial [Deltaproteobacteria bacterium]|nr:hypothetical protein [Deltaproteobacteria bacterium]